MQKYNKAIVYYDTLLVHNPKDSVALEEKGHALFHLDRFSEALACIDKALKINQNAADLWYQKSTLAEDFNEAIKYFDRALKFNPEFDDIFAVAITLGIRNKKKKVEKVEKILDWGTKAIKTLLYTVECYIADSSCSDEQMHRSADLTSEVIQTKNFI